jgi:probable addiction module antidote protein
VSKREVLDEENFRDNPAAIAEYLNRALGSGELADFLSALDAVIRAQNVIALSEVTGLPRANHYRMFARTNPGLANTMKVLAGLNVQFAIKVRSSPTPKRPRPKLGRPKLQSTV